MRHIIATVAIVIFALCTPAALLAKGFKTPEEAIALAEQAVKVASSGNLRGGMELVRPYTIVPTAEFDSMIGQAELQQPMMNSRFGKTIGYEFVAKDVASPSLIRVRYLQKFEQHATVWTFLIYNGKDGWTINTFKFEDNIMVAF